jgi:predicted methyltransferase
MEKTMLYKKLLAAVATSVIMVSAVSADALQSAIDGAHRSDKNSARDEFRRPHETLSFFEVKPGNKVVEIWPGGGWYTEILAPYLRDSGHFVAAHFPPQDKEGYFKRSRDAFIKKMQANPELYGKVEVTSVYPPAHDKLTQPGTADNVLTFRNVHNWTKIGIDQMMFDSFYEALKPGGILGVVEHRAPAGSSLEYMKDSGYVTEAYVVTLAENAGFELVESSPINNNPADTKDYEKGVWTLPPTLAMKDKDRDRYVAIGESDRMTLKFVKPE